MSQKRYLDAFSKKIKDISNVVGCRRDKLRAQLIFVLTLSLAVAIIIV